MPAYGVQFYGIEKVMAMYNSRQVDSWAIWHGKEFQFKGSGDAELATILEALKNSFNDPTYTLKVYEGIGPDQIKSNTPHDGSFNFKINVPDQMPGIGYVAGNANYNLVKKIEELEKEKQELLEQTEDPDSIGAVVDSAIVEIIKTPAKALEWMNVLNELFGQKPYQPVQYPTIVRQIEQPSPAAVGNINTVIAEPVLDEAKWIRIYKAVEILEAADPKLMEHLEQLAMMSQDKKAKFKSLLLMLENF